MISATTIRELLSVSLLTDPSDIESVDFIRPPSRNPVWKCKVRGYSSSMYLKLQSRKPQSSTLSEEVEVLKILTDHQLMTPQVITSGTLGSETYLITAGLPGKTEKLQNVSSVCPFFEDIVKWMSLLQSQTNLLPLLKKRAKRFIGRYALDFDPVHSARLELPNASKRLDRLTVLEIEHLLGDVSQYNMRGPAYEIIHGSIAPQNLLTVKGRLTGVVDFEATRIGDLMFDVAHYGLDLFESHGISTVRRWFGVCQNAYGKERIRYRALAFLIEVLLTRMNTTQSIYTSKQINELFSICNLSEGHTISKRSNPHAHSN